MSEPYNPYANAPLVMFSGVKPVGHKEIKTGEIIAWRAWTYYPYEKVLRSIVTGRIWHPGKPMPREDGPGVHALKRQLDAEFCAGVWSDPEEAVVVGRVALWGEVQCFSDGYRAEYGRVASIDDIRDGRLLPDLSHWFFYKRMQKRKRLINELRLRYAEDLQICKPLLGARWGEVL